MKANSVQGCNRSVMNTNHVIRKIPNKTGCYFGSFTIVIAATVSDVTQITFVKQSRSDGFDTDVGQRLVLLSS